MATATKSQTAIVEKSATKEVVVDVALPSRREFLFYIWGASIVMLLGETVAGIIWFSLPRFKEGEFGGIFRFSGGDVPDPGAAPLNEPAGRFWVSNTNEGLLTLYGVCTHLGCLPKWQAARVRFECPCHGSKFELDGECIEGPAPRGLDRFNTIVTFTNGETASTPPDGGPIPLNGRTIAELSIDTGDKITGPS